MRLRFWINILFLAGMLNVFAKPLCVVSYNVENLFLPSNDSISDDDEWTPDGDRQWSYTRYKRKVENIARVLTNIGEWEGVDAVGLQEVESGECVQRLCRTMRRGEYGYVHFDSPDRRGIDVAFVYKKARIDTLRTRAIPVDLTSAMIDGSGTTRDILYVCALVDRVDTLHFFVCHMPSRRGGAAGSEWKRAAAKQVLQNALDSVLNESSEARIIVMGDMNAEPANDLRGLTNRMNGWERKGWGTHKYQGKWNCLDQFYTSPALDTLSEVRIYDAEWIQETDEKYLGLKPKRTYNGFRYQNGFSDHLPVILQIFDEIR